MWTGIKYIQKLIKINSSQVEQLWTSHYVFPCRISLWIKWGKAPCLTSFREGQESNLLNCTGLATGSTNGSACNKMLHYGMVHVQYSNHSTSFPAPFSFLSLRYSPVASQYSVTAIHTQSLFNCDYCLLCLFWWGPSVRVPSPPVFFLKSLLQSLGFTQEACSSGWVLLLWLHREWGTHSLKIGNRRNYAQRKWSHMHTEVPCYSQFYRQ